MQTKDQRAIIQAWNMLSNGQGGFDFGGVLAVAEHLGIEDIGELFDGLMVVKDHKVRT